MALLEVEDLHAGYGDVPVLQGVSLQVREGDIVALIGANGAGKTTLLRTISGLVRPSSGVVRYRGRPVQNMTPEALVTDGLVHVPEGRRLFRSMTVLENLLVGGSSPAAHARRRENLETVSSLLPRVWERRSQIAGTLSGGEQQMVAIGRALMGSPRLLMLDEMSLGLAPLIVEQLFRIVSQLAERGMSILLVEQNTALALEVSRHGYVLEQGGIVIEDEAAALAADDRVRRAYLGI